jgi:YggT family protein
MTRFLIDVLSFVSYLLFLYMCIIIAVAVLSWLINFNVVNVRNQFVSSLWYFLRRITEPVFQPIRNILPDLGPIDISPVIVLLIIIFIREVIIPNLQRALL